MFGELAEKVCGSKPVHAAKGYYDGADAFISYHPHFTNTAIWDTQCGPIGVRSSPVAATLLDLLTEPTLLQQAQDEFRDRTGGGVGGTKWVAPLLPKDFAPPVDLRWPEYIQTARGEQWWIRTPATGSGAGDPL